MLFCTSCYSSSDTARSADSSAPVIHYQEEKTTYEKEFPYTDFSEKYGTLINYSTDSTSGDTVFLYREEASLSTTPFDYKYHVIQYKKPAASYEESSLIFPENALLLSICMSPDGYLLLFDSAVAYVYPPGNETHTLSFPALFKYGILFSESDTLICRSYLDSGYSVYNLKSGKSTGIYLEKDFLFTPNAKEHTLLCASGDTYLLITGNGLYEKEGESWTLKVPSERTGMYLSSFTPIKAEKTGEQEYSVFTYDCCYHYRPATDTDIPTDSEEISLTLVSLTETPFLKDIIVEYQLLHPELSISYEFLCPELPSSFQEYNTLLQKINAAIAADTAGDIYLLDYLPWEAYGEKGLLADLTEIASPYLTDENYFNQIITGCRTEKGQFVLPLSFEADFILCQEEFAPYVSNLHEFAEYLNRQPEKAGLVPYYYRENPAFFLAMLYHYYQDALYENGNVTLEHTQQFLEDIKIIYDRLSLSTDAQAADYKQSYFQNEHYHFVSDELWQVLALKNGNVCFYPGTLSNAYFMQQCWKVRDDFCLIPAAGFHPSRLFGIHAASPYQKESADFLTYLISYYESHDFTSGNLSTINVHEGVSVYKPVLNRFLDTVTDIRKEQYDVQDNFYYEKGYGNSYPVYLIDEEDKKIILDLFERTDTRLANANFRYNPAYALLKERTLPYLEGKVSLQQAANDVYSGLSLMQKEQFSVR